MTFIVVFIRFNSDKKIEVSTIKHEYPSSGVVLFLYRFLPISLFRFDLRLLRCFFRYTCLCNLDQYFFLNFILFEMPKVEIEVPHYHPLCLDKSIVNLSPFLLGLILQCISVVWYYEEKFYLYLNSIEQNYNFVFMLSMLGTTALLILLFLSIALSLPLLFHYSYLLIIMFFLALCQSFFGILLITNVHKVSDNYSRNNYYRFFFLSIGSGLLLFLGTLFFVIKCYNNKEKM